MDLQTEPAYRNKGLSFNQLIFLTIWLDQHRRGKTLSLVTKTMHFHAEAPQLQQGVRVHLSPCNWVHHIYPPRRDRGGFSLYCGASGHQVAACLIQETKVMPPVKIFSCTPRPTAQFHILAQLSHQCFSVSVLLDSGLAGNFVSQALVCSWSLPVERLPAPILVKVLDVGYLGAEPVIVVGLPRLQLHNSHINW